MASTRFQEDVEKNECNANDSIGVEFKVGVSNLDGLKTPLLSNIAESRVESIRNTERSAERDVRCILEMDDEEPQRAPSQFMRDDEDATIWQRFLLRVYENRIPILVFIYYMIGGWIYGINNVSDQYSEDMEESEIVRFIDGLYFVTTAITTVGFGDVHSPPHLRGFSIIFITVGLALVGDAIISKVSSIVESTLEKEEALKHVAEEDVFDEEAWGKDTEEDEESDSDVDSEGETRNTMQMRPSTMSRLAALAGGSAAALIHRSDARTNHMKELRRREKEKEMEEKRQKAEDEKNEAKRNYEADILREKINIVALFCFPIFVGGVVVGQLEGWNFQDCIYWGFVSSTTIGFGDLNLTNKYSRLFCTWYLVFAVVCVGNALQRFTQLSITTALRKKQMAFESMKITPEMILLMDQDPPDTPGYGHVDRFEFLTACLQALDKVDAATINKIMSKFEALDEDGSGTISLHDICQMKPGAESSAMEKAEQIVKSRGTVIMKSAKYAAEKALAVEKARASKVITASKDRAGLESSASRDGRDSKGRDSMDQGNMGQSGAHLGHSASFNMGLNKFDPRKKVAASKDRSDRLDRLTDARVSVDYDPRQSPMSSKEVPMSKNPSVEKR